MPYDYSDQEIKKGLEVALGVLQRNDSFLWRTKASERSVSHKLAEYLQIQFPDWNVDCEYNRKGLDPKILEGIRGCSRQRRTGRVFPDIIIHRRNTDANLLVIEMKIEGDDPCDIQKLRLFTSHREHFAYRLGLFMNFNASGKTSLRWFADGEEIWGNGLLSERAPSTH